MSKKFKKEELDEKISQVDYIKLKKQKIFMLFTLISNIEKAQKFTNSFGNIGIVPILNRKKGVPNR